MITTTTNQAREDYVAARKLEPHVQQKINPMLSHFLSNLFEVIGKIGTNLLILLSDLLNIDPRHRLLSSHFCHHPYFQSQVRRCRTADGSHRKQELGSARRHHRKPQGRRRRKRKKRTQRALPLTSRNQHSIDRDDVDVDTPLIHGKKLTSFSVHSDVLKSKHEEDLDEAMCRVDRRKGIKCSRQSIGSREKRKSTTYISKLPMEGLEELEDTMFHRKQEQKTTAAYKLPRISNSRYIH